MMDDSKIFHAESVSGNDRGPISFKSWGVIYRLRNQREDGILRFEDD